jgi:hypothetical protein
VGIGLWLEGAGSGFTFKGWGGFISKGRSSSGPEPPVL